MGERINLLRLRPIKSLIADSWENCPFSLDIRLLKEVDKTLWEKENVISSDAIILDHCKSWINLMKKCVENRGIAPLKVC